MNRLFSYGTLRNDKVQEAVFGRLLNGSNDSLRSYRLSLIEISNMDVVRQSGEQFHPLLVHSDSSNDVVEGMVFEITDEELQLADEYEAGDYKRIQLVLDSGKPAWVYVQK